MCLPTLCACDEIGESRKLTEILRKNDQTTFLTVVHFYIYIRFKECLKVGKLSLTQPFQLALSTYSSERPKLWCGPVSACSGHWPWCWFYSRGALSPWIFFSIFSPGWSWIIPIHQPLIRWRLRYASSVTCSVSVRHLEEITIWDFLHTQAYTSPMNVWCYNDWQEKEKVVAQPESKQGWRSPIN